MHSITNPSAMAGRPSNIGRTFILSFAITFLVLAATVAFTELFWLAGAIAGVSGWLFFLFTAREADSTTAMPPDQFLTFVISILAIFGSAFGWLLLWWLALAIRALLPG